MITVHNSDCSVIPREVLEVILGREVAPPIRCTSLQSHVHVTPVQQKNEDARFSLLSSSEEVSRIVGTLKNEAS